MSHPPILRLRPGVVVVRRDDHHLQVGFEPPHRVVLPGLPEIRALVDALQHEGSIRSASPRVMHAVDRLRAADLLEPDEQDRAVAVAVAPIGPRRLVDSAAPLLRAAGVRLTERADVRLLLAYGALGRELADPLVRDGIAHLAAVVTPWGWDVGPFVAPGETACLRCIDAARADHDPRHAVIVDQVARAAAHVPSSAALDALALGWIARDLTAYARGDRPSTWSTTVRLVESPGEEPVSERRWLRHPLCGCAWDALAG
ncbi:MAG: hypothetical protein ACXVWW_07800 [Nocardioides sp.]